MTPLWLVIVPLGALSLWHVLGILRGARAAARVGRGPLFTGKVVAPDPVVSPNGVACAHADVVVVLGKSRARHVRTAPAVLHRENGSEIHVDFTHSQLAAPAEPVVRRVDSLGHDPAARAWCTPTMTDVVLVTFEESRVECDGLYTVVGERRTPGSVAVYRDGELSKLEGTLLVARGDARAMKRAAYLPILVLAVLAAVGFAYAALLASLV